ncbi:MAG TPA: FtsX-like permease family protein, partial [Blastocatellia bacterium]|nr:FtsX-like permease family protein [Blastocatellia bacterium]
KEGGREGAGGVRGQKLRSALIMAEVALSLVVLIGAGLLIKSLNTLLGVNTGFVSENLLTLNVEMSRFKEPARRAALARQVVERVAQVPGVEAVGGGTGLPPQTPQRNTRFEIEGIPDLSNGGDIAYFMAATPDYFRALGTPLVQGRVFDERDSETSPKVVIINQSLARRLFPNQEATGRHLKLISPDQAPDWREIVGVVGDIRYRGLDDPGEAAVYTPFSQTPFYWTYLMVRTSADPAAVAAGVRKAISSVDSNLTAASLRTMDDLVSESVSQPRFNATLLSIFAGLALVLASVGIYGVISYTVAQRTREIGIRMALGARPSDVLRLVLTKGMRLVLAGVVIGLAGAFVLTRVLESMLFGVTTTDPATYLIVTLLLAFVALVACYTPARRATKVDPMVALRYE